MNTAVTVEDAEQLVKAAPKGRSLWEDAWIRLKKDKMAMACLGIVVFYFALALFIKIGLVPVNWAAEVGTSYQPPTLSDWRLIFGADIFGRSVLMKAVFGTYVSMSVAILSVFLAVPIGVFMGAIAGYFGGLIDELVTWVYTTISNIPSILLLVSMTYVMDKGILSMSIALGVTAWVGICRLIRGEFMKHRDQEYVVAAKSLGMGHMRRIFRHILPNVFHLIIIQISFRFLSAILAEVILSYLGLGVQNMPSWGTMIDEAKLELARGVWWQLAAATTFIFFIALAFNILGDALRDCLDPKLK